MNNHLFACDFTPEDVRKKAKRFKGLADDSDVEEGLGKRSQLDSIDTTDLPCASKKQAQFQIKAARALNFNAERQISFKNQLLRAVVSAGWSFYLIEDPKVKKLFHDFSPGSQLPTCHCLSGTILSREVVKIGAGFRTTDAEVYATLQCDGWKDNSRWHIVAFMFTARGSVSI
jgi:hypothetical protein